MNEKEKIHCDRCNKELKEINGEFNYYTLNGARKLCRTCYEIESIEYTCTHKYHFFDKTTGLGNVIFLFVCENCCKIKKVVMKVNDIYKEIEVEQ